MKKILDLRRNMLLKSLVILILLIEEINNFVVKILALMADFKTKNVQQ